MITNRRNIIFAIAAAALLPHVTMAQESGVQDTEDIIPYLLEPHIAYIQTQSERVNSASAKGMTALQEFLDEKTSLRPKGVVELNPETDSFLPFKFIYWPIAEEDQPLSESAQEKVQEFIRARKIVLFDNRTRNPDNLAVLQSRLGDVNLGLMQPMDEDHPLMGVFYKVSNLPGITNYGPVQVQALSSTTSESVSSVIIAQRDWANAWTGIGVDKKGKDMALRGAANTVLYAYTGNYKADQLIVDQSLERINE
jgi:hypothetical protein